MIAYTTRIEGPRLGSTPRNASPRSLPGPGPMAWHDWLTKNWADLEPGADDPGLEAVLMPEAPAEALRRAAGIVEGLPRWAVVSADPEAATLHATHATRLWHFLDDIRLRFEPVEGGTLLTGRSRSRIGKGDFGQNARQLRQLAATLRASAPPGG